MGRHISSDHVDRLSRLLDELPLLRRIRPWQRLRRQARTWTPEIRGFGILPDGNDAAPDRAGAGEKLEQRVAVGRLDRVRELRHILVEATEHFQNAGLV